MYVVAGATGNTGGAVARTLIDRGLPVRIIVRDAAKGKAWSERGVEVAIADLSDEAAVSKAFSGAEGAYVLNPPAYRSDHPLADANRVGTALRKAADESKIGKLVVLSSIGSHKSSGLGIIQTTRILEEAFQGTAAAVTFLRASYFMENWAQVASVAEGKGVLPSFLAPLDRAIPMVAAEDIGRVAAEALLDTWKGTRVVELAGPRDYSPNDVATAFSKILGRPVQAIAVPESDWPGVLAQSGASSAVAALVIEMNRSLNSGWIQVEGKGAMAVRGRVTIEEAVAVMVKKSR
jgi:uncharacterized protein YbjT (DUF2867 family)